MYVDAQSGFEDEDALRILRFIFTVASRFTVSLILLRPQSPGCFAQGFGAGLRVLSNTLKS